MHLGYARASKDEQADALLHQVARLRDAGCADVIQELISGGNNDRPGILELIKRLERGEVDQISITRVDRLGRDAQFADALLAMCAEKGVTVTALDGGEIESATPGGFLISRMLTTVAEHEKRMLSQRLKTQFAAMRKQGRSLRRRVPFGYEQHDGKLLPHPENWAHALRVIEELNQHRSFSRVARELPSWCPWTPAASNLIAWWVNPVIRGHVPHLHDPSSGKSWGSKWDEIYYDQHAALISEADWQHLSIQLRQTKNRFEVNSPGGGEPRHALTGLLKCHGCSHRLTRNTSAGTAWWRCRYRLCKNRAGVKEATVLSLAIGHCREQAARLAEVALGPGDADPRRAPLLVELEAAQAHLMRNPHRKSAELAVVEIAAELKGLERPQVGIDPEQLALYTELFKEVGTFELAEPDEMRAVLNELLTEVRVGRGGAPITPIYRQA